MAWSLLCSTRRCATGKGAKNTVSTVKQTYSQHRKTDKKYSQHRETDIQSAQGNRQKIQSTQGTDKKYSQHRETNIQSAQRNTQKYSQHREQTKIQSAVAWSPLCNTCATGKQTKNTVSTEKQTYSQQTYSLVTSL